MKTMNLLPDTCYLHYINFHPLLSCHCFICNKLPVEHSNHLCWPCKGWQTDNIGSFCGEYMNTDSFYWSGGTWNIDLIDRLVKICVIRKTDIHLFTMGAQESTLDLPYLQARRYGPSGCQSCWFYDRRDRNQYSILDIKPVSVLWGKIPFSRKVPSVDWLQTTLSTLTCLGYHRCYHVNIIM